MNLKNLCNKAIRKGLAPLETQELLTMSEWADKHFYLSPESSGTQGLWETLPYQKAIMNIICNDAVGVVSWQKSARTGYTKILDITIGYFSQHKKRNIVVYQPTDSDAEEFSKDEVETMLRDVPIVGDALRVPIDKKSKYNTINKKSFHGCTLDIKGATSPRNFRRMSKDLALYDETDGVDDDVGKEGSYLLLGDKRLENSPFPKSVRGSTPKVKGVSQIEKSISEADMVFERYLPCPACGNYHPLSWSTMKYWDKDPETVRHQCLSCESMVDYSSYSEMDSKGRWQTTENDISKDLVINELDNDYESYCYISDDDGFIRNQAGEIVDYPHHVGFKSWSSYSYFSPWSVIVRDHIAAQVAVKKGDNTKLKTWVNTTLGETWEEKGESVDENVLYSRREHYSSAVPESVLYLTAFVDVQDNRVEGEVAGWGEGEECWTIEYFVLHGDLSRAQIWKTLAEKLRGSYVGDKGQKYDIKMVGIDSGGHFTDEVYKFSRKNGIRWVVPTKGSSIRGKPIANYPTKKTKKGVYLTIVGTDTAKELVYKRYYVDDPGPGYMHHPVADWCDEDYFKQATAEEKIIKYSAGVPYFVWDAKKRRNEVLDCKVGNLVIIRILQQHFGVKLIVKPKEDIVEQKNETMIDKLQKSRKGRGLNKSGNFVNGWRK